MNRRLLLAFSVLFTTISVALRVTGGFSTSVAGLRVSAHSPAPALAAALVCAASWFALAWRARAIHADLAAVDAWIGTRANALVTVIAGLAAAIAVRFGSFSAGGADASGYFSEAAMLSSGALSRAEPLALVATWPDAATTLAPLGWRSVDGLQVPTYAVGLPLLMAIPHALGGPLAASLVVAAAAALVVWFAGRLATLIAGAMAGVLAAVWIATLPIEIFESIQPMSDVPVTAAWLACWWNVARSATASNLAKTANPSNMAKTAKKGTVPFLADSAIQAGLWASLAVLIRPNLAPLAALPAACLLFWPDRNFRTRALRASAFAVPVAAAGLTVGYLQWRWFGSPFRSGYGTAAEIYSLSNVAPNAALYLRWLLETHGPWLLAAPLALAVSRARLLRWMLAFAALVCAAYFAYAVFENWPYLRFLLPAMAVAVIAVSAAIATILSRLPAPFRAPVPLLLVLALAGSQIARARELSVFELASGQSRALLAGRYLASALPANAVLLTGEQSGAMRYYTTRSIVRWDLLAAESLSPAVAQIGAAGREIWIVLDDWEIAPFRERFRGGVAWADLDWPPAVDAGLQPRTQAWRTADRDRFVRGTNLITDRLR